MAWRYRGPKGFVSQGKYERYKHLDTYTRVSDANWGVRGVQRKNIGEKIREAKAASKFYGDLAALYDKFDPEWMDGDFENQGEYETGVDYGEEE